MAAHSFQDSNYGSLSLQSSSSSFTMSLSESEADYLPSTSGCSSDLPYPKRVQLKEKRKEQVKRYLKQLKSMVPQPHGNKMGTLSALQHVVDSFKKIKEDGENPAAEKPTELLENELSLTTFEGQDDLSLKIVKLHECIHLHVELPDLVVAKVSSNFKHVLGYPTDAWMGRCLDDFVHRWDVVTMKSSIAINRDSDITPDTAEDKEVFPKEKISVSRLRRKVFYFRLRSFKHLRNGYNIQNDSKYQAFQACLSIAHKPDPGIVLDEVVNKFHASQEGLILQCTPLRSVYEVEGLPEKDLTFHTRHNLFCSYSHIDPKAITILGYLPQDVIGTSIFNFYHVDDMELLYNIYKQILMTSKTPFKSMPFRFRMRNGGWVFVETEWSSFVNPWTHKLDFVIGKHTVVKSQNSALKNLSSENLYNSYFKEQDIVWGEKSMKYQSSIRELLLQPLSGLSAQFDVEVSQPKSEEQSSEKPMVTEEEEGAVSLDNVSLENVKADKAPKRKVAGGICNAQICDDEVSVAYEQLNYTSNIKRFLLSQPNSFSPSTFKKSSAEESSDTGESVLEVDISVPKPPSFGSSTKVLVSEQEQREEVALSPAVIPTDEENLKEAAIKEALTQPSGVMTQKSLFEHTRQQEQLFIQEAKQDCNLIVLKRNCPQVSELSSLCLKRSHSPDRINERQCRAMKSMKPLHGVQIPEGSGLNLVKGNTLTTVTSGQPVFVPVNIGQPGFSFMQIDPTSGVPNVIVSSPLTSGNVSLPIATQQATSSMQWPYYPQSGVSFIPQVMGGFYQSGMGLTVGSQPVQLGPLVTSMQVHASTDASVPISKLNSVGSAMTTNSSAGHIQPHYSQAGEDRRKKLSSDFLSSSSFEESSSSLYYLLESEGGSLNISSGCSVQEQHTKRKKKKTHSRIGLPPWLMGIKWTAEVQMLYRLPVQRKALLMKKDREFLCKIRQPDQVISQFQLIDEEVTQSPLRIEDEESDYLLWPEYFTETDSKPLKCMSGHCDHDDQVDETDRSALYCDDEIGESASGKGFDLGNISSNGDDASSSKSSDLTASDERSNEELGSSLKESDACSSDQGSFGDQKCRCETEVETNIPETPNIKFDNYFSMLPVEFSSDEKDSPFWLQNSIFNEKVAMNYCLQTSNLEKQLQEDRKRLESMEQSTTVLSHFSEIIEEMSEISGNKNPLSSEQSCSIRNEDKTSSHAFDSFFESMFSLLVPGEIVSPVTDGLGVGDISDSFMDTVD